VIVGFGLPFTFDVLLEEAWFDAIVVPVAWLVPIGIIAGALAGVIQTADLRRHSPKAGWWIWMSAVTYGMTALFFSLLGDAAQGLIAGALVAGVLSGGFLVWLGRTS
jgi:hypothetical protein